jgi:hypothetical protein
MSLSQLSRRGLLTTAALTTVSAVAAGAAHAAPSGAQPAGSGGRPGGSSRDLVAFLSEMTDAYPDLTGGPRLPQSYADELGLFSTAFVYDSAIATCAALAAGMTSLAATIGDGLVYAQQHDPGFDDGRLRQAYNVGPYTFYDGSPQDHGLVLPDGTANISWQFGFLGTAVGDMAWPGIALAHLAARTHRSSYRDAALRIGEWILDRAVNPGTLGGFRFGVNGADEAVIAVSTEHNIDCIAFFTLLDRLGCPGDWRDAARQARAFVDQMWEPELGCFYTGSDDGSTINVDPLPLDPQTWGWLAMRERRYAGALDWAASTLATTDSPSSSNSQLPEGVTVTGVTFSDASLVSTASYNGIPVCPEGVWLEGTAQLATALRDRGRGQDRRSAGQLLAHIEDARTALGAGQHVGGREISSRGVVAASSLIDTGFGFGYFQVQHVGATGWTVLARERANPMRWRGL